VLTKERLLKAQVSNSHAAAGLFWLVQLKGEAFVDY